MQNFLEQTFCIYIYKFMLYNVLKKSNNIIDFDFYMLSAALIAMRIIQIGNVSVPR